MFEDLKRGFYWILLFCLAFVCAIITIKLIYYLSIAIITIGIALLIKELYERKRRK